MKRDFQKLKTLDDFCELDVPEPISSTFFDPTPPCDEQYILRLLLRPKYGSWVIPKDLFWLKGFLTYLTDLDAKDTGIVKSWCYLTIRHGPIQTYADTEWHFDGASFRTSVIPERNYVWMDKSPFQYKLGNLSFPEDFDPTRHCMFSFAESALSDSPILEAKERLWYRLTPFCFHRRNPQAESPRTFIRISFMDIEIRDENNTPNPLLATPAWGRYPALNFRSKLEVYR